MEKKRNLLTVVLFCGFLAVFFLLYLFLPKETFSEKEKRRLAELPEADMGAILDGRFEAALESWYADHVPLRDALVGLQARYELLSGRNGLNGVILGRSGRLYAAPDVPDEEDIVRKCTRVNALAEATGLPCTVMLIPSSGYMNEDDLPRLHARYHDADVRALARESLNESIDLLWPEEDFRAAGEGLYYATDHHLTSAGSYRAAGLFLKSVGRELPPAEDYDVQRVGGFRGTQYAKAGLWDIAAETLELWRYRDQAPVAVRFDDREPAGDMFFEEQLEGSDKYSTFLDGNHGLVTIETAGHGGGTLLIVRDSYGHCFAPFCAASYEKIILVDPRYYRTSIADLAAQEKADRILVLYSVSNFITDTNLARIR